MNSLSNYNYKKNLSHSRDKINNEIKININFTYANFYKYIDSMCKYRHR